MPTIIDSLFVTFGLDPSGMKKGAAEGTRIQKKLEDDTKKSSKRMSEDDKKRAEEQKKQNKQATEQSRAIADGIRKVRNETLGLLGLFMGGVGVKNFVANTVEQAASLKFLSENLEMSVESIQAYQRASERMGGSAAGMTAQLQESQRELSRLRTGQGPSEAMQATFRAAGMAGEALTQKDLSTGNDYLMARSRIIATLYKQNAANAALMSAQMGISEEQFNLIKQGPAELQRLMNAQMKNSVISKGTAEQALKLKNTWLDFTDSMQATGTGILVSLIPVLKKLLKLAQDFADYVRDHKKDIDEWIGKIDFDKSVASAKVLLGTMLSIVEAVGAIVKFFSETPEKTGFEKDVNDFLAPAASMLKLILGGDLLKSALSSNATKVGAGTPRSSARNAGGNGANTPRAGAQNAGAMLSSVGASSVAHHNTSVSTSNETKTLNLTVNASHANAKETADAITGQFSRYFGITNANFGMK